MYQNPTRRGGKPYRFSLFGFISRIFGIGLLLMVVGIVVLFLLSDSKPISSLAFNGGLDSNAASELQSALEEIGISGTSVKVRLLADSGGAAFITLDSSQGHDFAGMFKSLSPNLDDMLKTLSNRNRDKDLGINHLIFDIRNSLGESTVSFSTAQANIDDYFEGSKNSFEFFIEVQLNVLPTLQYLGLDELAASAVK